jgi:hypothetical protein
LQPSSAASSLAPDPNAGAVPQDPALEPDPAFTPQSQPDPFADQSFPEEPPPDTDGGEDPLT